MSEGLRLHLAEGESSGTYMAAVTKGSVTDRVLRLEQEVRSLTSVCRGEQGMEFEDGYAVNVADLRERLKKIHEQATRHLRATGEREYLLRDLEFIAALAVWEGKGAV